ncbi:MAG: class I SAM-dependent methyltransferase [Roseiarcus sp.]|jgi:ubiquinone/menaquinone biosynthesis C-methylase UbiE
MSIPFAPAGAADQAAYWNGPGARRWTGRDETPDAVFAPIADRLYARARVAPGERVIDVGCGCGGTTLELAARVGAAGRAIGLDISAPMIARARERAGAASAAEFVLADAAAHEFAPGWADLLFSRFGVMFFADPVLAFANLRRGLARGGRAVFACWREARLNPWQTIPLKAACKHVPRLPEVGPEDPGPFSFADEARARRILAEAGFERIALTPVDLELDLAAGGGLEAAVAALQQIGAAARALEGQSDDRRAAALAEIRAALAPHRRGMSLPLGAAIWIVEAANP